MPNGLTPSDGLPLSSLTGSLRVQDELVRCNQLCLAEKRDFWTGLSPESAVRPRSSFHREVNNVALLFHSEILGQIPEIWGTWECETPI